MWPEDAIQFLSVFLVRLLIHRALRTVRHPQVMTEGPWGTFLEGAGVGGTVLHAATKRREWATCDGTALGPAVASASLERVHFSAETPPLSCLGKWEHALSSKPSQKGAVVASLLSVGLSCEVPVPAFILPLCHHLHLQSLSLFCFISGRGPAGSEVVQTSCWSSLWCSSCLLFSASLLLLLFFLQLLNNN